MVAWLVLIRRAPSPLYVSIEPFSCPCFACLLQLNASLTPEKRLENEAERLRLKQLLLKLEAGTVASSTSDSTRRASSSSRASSANAKNAGRTASAKGDSESSTNPVAAPQASMASLGSSPAAAGDAKVESAPRRGPVPPKIPALVSGHYVLDFGCVTKGINKSRKVKLTNMSTQQVWHKHFISATSHTLWC